MTIRLIRIFFVILSIVCGYYLGSTMTSSSAVQGGILGAFLGFILAGTFIFLEIKLQHVSLRNLSASAFGLVFGFFMAWMVTLIVKLVPMEEEIYAVFQIIFTLIFCYLGMIISLKGKDEFNLVIPYVRFSREDQREQLFLLDTSVIIDGRVAGICETGFIRGKLVVPRFVLHELQQVADSSDDAKRNRGRRGLDMLNRLKKTEGVEVIIHDENLTDIKGVDAKLVRLGKILGCNVLTNDFNLNKVAKIEGVPVLNINDLADALKPVVFPGEQMNVYIRKEGKERNQGVAFLDDGTMIVVDDARRMVGKSANVTISSVLQTAAGRMIFATLVERPERDDLRDENRDERPSRPERRDDRPRPERPDRPDRPERQERPDYQERTDRQDRPERNDRPDRQEGADRQERQPRRDDRHGRGGHGRHDRYNRGDRRPDNQQRGGQPQQGQPQQSGQQPPQQQSQAQPQKERQEQRENEPQQSQREEHHQEQQHAAGPSHERHHEEPREQHHHEEPKQEQHEHREEPGKEAPSVNNDSKEENNQPSDQR